MDSVLNQHFTFRKLIAYTFPTVIMMIATSIYTIIDGLFISNAVNDTAFAGVNFVFPIVYVIGVIGFMFGNGGAALVSKRFGQGKFQEGNEIFSFLMVCLAIIGAVLGLISFFAVDPIIKLLGISDLMYPYASTYGQILSLFLPFIMSMYAFQSFMVVAGKPGLGFIFAIIAGVVNTLGDYLLVVVFKCGVAGAAIASGLSQIVGTVLPVAYLFFFKKKTPLHFVKFRFNGHALLRAASNGLSEMVSNISYSVIGILLNSQLMIYFGEDGVSAYGIIAYLALIFVGVYYGYASGVSPVISFHYGAKNKKELQSLFSKSLILYAILSIVMPITAIGSARILSMAFSNGNEALLELATHAVRIYSISYFISGFSIFASAFFTALNNGLISGVLSFLRAFVFQIIFIFCSPLIFGPDGLWMAVIFSELCSLITSIIFLIKGNKRYQYVKTKRDEEGKNTPLS